MARQFDRDRDQRYRDSEDERGWAQGRFSGDRNQQGGRFDRQRQGGSSQNRGTGGTRDWFEPELGRRNSRSSSSGSFERESDDYSRNMGREDRGRGGRTDADDDHSQLGRESRFGNRGNDHGRYSNDDDRGRSGGRGSNDDDEDYVRGGGPSRFGNRGDQDRDAMGRLTGADDDGGSRRGRSWRNRDG